jgi:hypothetical protein
LSITPDSSLERRSSYNKFIESPPPLFPFRQHDTQLVLSVVELCVYLAHMCVYYTYMCCVHIFLGSFSNLDYHGSLRNMVKASC